jgi:hypothetical protein
MSESEFKEPVFYVPGTPTIIDTAVIRDGIFTTAIKGETLDQVRIRYPEAEIGEWDVVYQAVENSCKTEPQEITEAQFIYALEVLPPVCWKTAKGVESFKMSERFYGNVTAIYARLGKRYFTFNDLITLSPDEIADRTANSAAFKHEAAPFITLEELRALNPSFHRSEQDVEGDFEILGARIKKLNERHGPRVGDFVIFPDDSVHRFTHNWAEYNGGIQTTPEGSGGSFHLSKQGFCDYSGGLDPCIPLDRLQQTNELRLGSVWFFSRDLPKAHNGVRAKIPFRVYRYTPSSEG